jgi:HlyD family secretion protein
VSRRRLLTGVALASIALVAYSVYRHQRANRPFEWSGTVEARTIEVGSRIGGRVQAVLVREGDFVDEGQPLLVLETADLEAQRLSAQGQLEQAEAALEKVSQRGPSARREEIAAARARLQAAQAVMDKAVIDHRRIEQLFAGGASARAEVDAANSALRNATAQRDAQAAQLGQLLHTTPQDVKAAVGLVDSARGRLEQIRTFLEELTIRAPRRARVESLDLRPGDLLAPNAAAAKLLEPEELFVRIYVPETQLGHVRPGLEVPIAVDTFARRTFKGVVEFVSDVGEFTPRNLQTADERADQVFATRVRLEEGRDVLRAGMAAIVRVRR